MSVMAGSILPNRFLGGLSWQGTRAVATTILVGIAVTPLGAALRTFLPEAVLAWLCIAFMRFDPDELRRHLDRSSRADGDRLDGTGIVRGSQDGREPGSSVSWIVSRTDAAGYCVADEAEAGTTDARAWQGNRHKPC